MIARGRCSWKRARPCVRSSSGCQPYPPGVIQSDPKCRLGNSEGAWRAKDLGSSIKNHQSSIQLTLSLPSAQSGLLYVKGSSGSGLHAKCRYAILSSLCHVCGGVRVLGKGEFGETPGERIASAIPRELDARVERKARNP